MALLFVSNIVPDRAPYNGAGFTRSSNNVFLGMAKALPEDAVLVSCRPIASFPHGPLWLSGESVALEDGRKIEILPVLNLKIVKNLLWGIQIRRFIRKWAKTHKDERRDVLIYNVYTPPVSSVYKACRKYGCKLTAILYDLGIPPKRLGLGRLTMMGYRKMEKQAEKYIPRLDGRIVINEAIISHYSPGKDYLLVDGGINEHVASNLFSLKESTNKRLKLVLAGMLWDQNGTKLILDCLAKYPELDVEVYFAGQGIDVPLIRGAALHDGRIKYVGLLDQKSLFRLYSEADVLLNLRLEEEVDFHFPSKLLEYLVTGKHVVSTPVAHAERDYGAYMSLLHDKTPDGLAKLLKELISRSQADMLSQGRDAREFMLANRNWDVRTREMIEYINKL